MKKKLLLILCTALLLCASMSVFAFAEQVYEDPFVTQPVVYENLYYVADDADLLTPAQEAELNTKLSALSAEKNADFVVLTVASLNGKTALSYADDYFDYNGYGQREDRTGMLLLYKTGTAGDREVAISTSGEMYSCVTDADSDTFLDSIIPDLVSENYVSAFEAFVLFADQQSDEIGKLPTLPLMYIPLCLLIGFVVAFVVLKIQTASLKSVNKERSARYYVKQGSLVLQDSRDRFLYRNVKKTPRQTQSSSSGTSGRTGSSGARHGGTSKKF